MPRAAAAALLLLVCVSYSLISFPPETASAQGYGGNLEQLKPYLHYLAEFNQRRRGNIYFPNEQSVFYGAHVNFVNVGQGNLTFTRRDLVTVGRMPLVAARVYDSAGPASLEFGPGWQLSAAERIEVRDGVATLFSETGAEIRFAESGNEFVLSPDFPSDHARLTRSGSGALVSRMRTGHTRVYEPAGNVYRLASVTDRNGNQVRLIYSGGLLARMENAGHYLELTRNAAGRVIEIRDDQNRRVLYAYDDKGLLTQVTDLGGNLWTYQYTGQDLLHRAVDPGGRENFKCWYTSDRRVQAVDLPSGRIAYSYDDAARATTVVDRKTLTSRYFQNGEGVTTQIVNALGEETDIQLDAGRNVTEIRQNGQLQHQLEYDGEHRLTFRQSFVGGETTAQYQYDGSGNLSRITHGDGTQAEFGYNAQGNLLSVSDAEGLRTYQYSATGDVTEFRNGESHLSLGYTADGLVSEAEDESEYSTTLVYNPTGRPVAVNFGNATTVQMEFDGLGLRRKQDYGSGGRVDYWYDPAGNLTEIKVIHPDGTQVGQKLLLDASYQIVKQTLSNGIETTFGYDKNGNLAEVRSGTEVARFEYDAVNRLTAVVTPKGQRLTYSYAPGERSLIARYDHGASLSATERRDSGLTFGGYWEVTATRTLASQFGAVRYSEALGKFQLSGSDDKEVVTAESSVLTPLEKLRLYHYGVPLDERVQEFQKPSNLLFLPPEYATVNCCPQCTPQNPGGFVPVEEPAPCECAPAAEPPPPPAKPTNFRLTAAEDLGDGYIYLTYQWESSTGRLADLIGCTVGEITTYPGVGDYQPPSPPWPVGPGSKFPNPTQKNGLAEAGGLFDSHTITNRNFVKPYSTSKFTATQFYRYSCSGGSYVNLAGPLSIVRELKKNSQGLWVFVISKTGTTQTSTLVLNPQ